jgi:hypothetical protein
MDRLVLTEINSKNNVEFHYPQISFQPSVCGYLYFKTPSGVIFDADGFISVPSGWYSELIKGGVKCS